jgi:hypothetical protein
MNRRARREFERAKRGARLETAEITAYCAWPTCREPVIAATQGDRLDGFEFAQLALQQHYDEKHGGRGPQPITGPCIRCKAESSWVPGTVLMMCEACKMSEHIA